MRGAVVVGVVVVSACYFGDGQGLPCKEDVNCPAPLACVSGGCFDRVIAVDAAPFDPFIDAESTLADASSLRVLVDDGDVEVYFADADCGVARLRPGASFDVIATDDDGGCFVDADAARDGAGVVEVAARLDRAGGGSVVSAFVVGGDRDDYALAGGDRGRAVGVVVDDVGAVRAFWLAQAAQGPQLIEEIVVGAAGEPSLFGSFEVPLLTLAAGVNDDGVDVHFAVDAQRRLLDFEPGGTEFVAPGVSGDIDAVRCGDALHVAFWTNDALHVSRAVIGGDDVDDPVEEGLDAAAVGGAVALACDDAAGALWLARNSGGLVQLAQRGPDRWVSEVVDAGRGAVAAVVDGGRVVVAYGSDDGRVRVAIRR